MLSEPTSGMYAGISREQASRTAQAICRTAGDTGQTVLAARHLALLIPIIEAPETVTAA